MDAEIIEEDGIAAAGSTESDTVAGAAIIDAQIIGVVDKIARVVELDGVEHHEEGIAFPYTQFKSIGGIVAVACGIETDLEAVDGVDSRKGENLGLALVALHLEIDIAVMGIVGIVIARWEAAGAACAGHRHLPAVGELAGGIALEILYQGQGAAAHHIASSASRYRTIRHLGSGGAETTHTEGIGSIGKEAGNGVGVGGSVGHSDSPGGVGNSAILHYPSSLGEAGHPVERDTGGGDGTDSDTGGYTAGIAARGNEEHIGTVARGSKRRGVVQWVVVGTVAIGIKGVTRLAAGGLPVGSGGIATRVVVEGEKEIGSGIGSDPRSGKGEGVPPLLHGAGTGVHYLGAVHGYVIAGAAEDGAGGGVEKDDHITAGGRA